jgi:hypothetical protein
MAGIRDKLAKAIPRIDPILDHFDWRKQLITLGAAIALAVWSFVTHLPWPVIAVLAGATIVVVAFVLVFPAFVKLIYVGVNPRPNFSIWKHKRQFALFEAACLLADRVPLDDPALMSSDSKAWAGLLIEAVKLGEIKHVATMNDRQDNFEDGYHATLDTLFDAAELKKFSEARGRKPEFLNW